jgi:hypothetical protein
MVAHPLHSNTAPPPGKHVSSRAPRLLGMHIYLIPELPEATAASDRPPRQPPLSPASSPSPGAAPSHPPPTPPVPSLQQPQRRVQGLSSHRAPAKLLGLSATAAKHGGFGTSRNGRAPPLLLPPGTALPLPNPSHAYTAM